MFRVQMIFPACNAIAMPRTVPFRTTTDNRLFVHLCSILLVWLVDPMQAEGRYTCMPKAVDPTAGGLPFSSILPKIILPLAVCSTLVTVISTDLPISLRA